MVNPNKPLVSIVTGLFNSGRYLDNYFAILEQQTFKDWEAILVDDGSTDDTVIRVRQRMDGDPRYRLIQKSPEGYPSRSRQKGLEASVGKYVAFCDHDDLWAPQKLAMQVMLMERYPDTAVLYTDRVVWTAPTLPAPFFHQFRDLAEIPTSLQRPEEVIYAGLRIVFSSIMAPRELLVQVGFHPQMKGVDDFYLFIRLASLGAIRELALPLTYYRAHQSNLSHARNIFVDGLYQVHRILENDDVPEVAKRAVLAQAYRTEAVSFFADNRLRAFRLLFKSLRLYFIPTTLNRLLFLLVTFLVPTPLQQKLFVQVKRLKFIFPTFRDVFRRSSKS